MSNIDNRMKDITVYYDIIDSGFSLIALKNLKIPNGRWKDATHTAHSKESFKGHFNNSLTDNVGLVCGFADVEVIDVDLKVFSIKQERDDFWEEYLFFLKESINDFDDKFVLYKTANNGYHILYKSKRVVGNSKIAKLKGHDEALIETRGTGGQVAMYVGNNVTDKTYKDIDYISDEDREILWSCSKSFNYIEPQDIVIPAKTKREYNNGLSCWDDYNSQTNIMDLLQGQFSIVGQHKDKFVIKRQGSNAPHSGYIFKDSGMMYLHSTGTSFDAEKGYTPFTVYAHLNHNDDLSETAKELYKQGYGDRIKATPEREVEPFVAPEGMKFSGDVDITPKGLEPNVRDSDEIDTYIPFNKSSLKFVIKEGATSFTLSGFDSAQEIHDRIEILTNEGVSRIYVVNEVNTVITYYEWQLGEILHKYGVIEVDQGSLSHRDKDDFLEEIIATASRLSPINKEQYIRSFMDEGFIDVLGITEESLSLTVDRITATRNKDAQARDFKNLLSEATTLQDKGEVNKALELISGKVNEIKLQDKATEFSSLLLPIKQEELKQRLITKPESINSGYTIGGEDLLLPSGALTILAAPTSHGKTTFLINLALNTTKSQPEKEIYLFSYEEDSDSILINALNTYLNRDISGNNRTTLKNHFSGVNKTTIEGKDKFFSELIDTNRLSIHYSNYTSDILIEAIRYLHKNTNVGAVFIDYIQLLNLPNGKYKTYSRQEEIKQICIALKDIAVETGLPIILGAQFNRTVQNQLQIHPTKIGEAGDIERIANLIIGFWNNRFKTIATDGERNEISLLGCEDPNTIYAEVLKNRGGRVGLNEVFSFNGNTGNISNMDKQVNTEIEF